MPSSPSIQTVPQPTFELNTEPAVVDQNRSLLGGAYHPWRRFFARAVDLAVFGTLTQFMVLMPITSLFPVFYIDYLHGPFSHLIFASVLGYLLWIPIEAIFLAATGTTPSKCLFGIRVLQISGDRLSLATAFQRTGLVFFVGEGLGIPLITLITRLAAYQHLTRRGTTRWDTATGSVVTHTPWGILRTILCVLAVFFAMMLLGILRSSGSM